MLLEWLKRKFSSSKAVNYPHCRSEEHLYLENEIIRLEGSFRAEIKDIWRVFNDQQAKTLKLEKARTMKFPEHQEKKEEGNPLMEKARRMNSYGNR